MSQHRFVYITDTHLGSNEHGHQMQPRYLGHDEKLFDGLARWLKQHDVSFVIHGGDIVEHGTREEIEYASQLCDRLDVPVYVSLGNHDLMLSDSMDNWKNLGRTSHGPMLPEGKDCFAIDVGPVVIVVITHHWHSELDHRWILEDGQDVRIGQRQEDTLLSLLGDGNRPAIAATHMLLNPISAAQRNAEEPLYPPPPTYLESWQRIAAARPNLRLVLAGHNHTHTHFDHGNFISCSTASYAERPAQLRLVTIDDEKIHVETHTLAGALDLPTELLADSAWSIGMNDTQSFSIPL